MMSRNSRTAFDARGGRNPMSPSTIVQSETFCSAARSLSVFSVVSPMPRDGTLITRSIDGVSCGRTVRRTKERMSLISARS